MSLKVARDRADEVRLGARRGEDLTVNPRKGEPTFAEAWREMIDEVDKPKLSPATISDYEDRADRLILPRIGSKRIGDVTPADVDKAVAAANGARNRAYVATLIKKTINHAKRAHLLPDNHRNPAADVSIKKSPKRGRALEIEDVEKFGAALAAMEVERSVSPWLANLLRLSLLCGLRPGEVRTLQWARVNMPKRKMTVVGKTGAREIFLTDAATVVLESTPRVQGCEYVFAGRRYGQPIAGVYKVLQAVRKKAGIEHFRPYDLRHSAATGALAAGADVRAVQALLGHADLATTAGYLHDTEKRRRSAAELAAGFGRAVLK
jgi:integrase